MASFGRDFGRGLARTGPAAAQQAMMLTLRQVLEEPRTEAELQMRERQLRLSEDENRIRMDLLREQLANTRADAQFEAESRARATSPEALDRQRREQEADIGAKEALKGQRERNAQLLSERLAAIEKDPEKLKALELYKGSDAVRYAETPEAAAASIASFLVALDSQFAKRRGTTKNNKPEQEASGGQPEKPSQDGLVTIKKGSQMKRVNRKSADALIKDFNWVEVK